MSFLMSNESESVGTFLKGITAVPKGTTAPQRGGRGGSGERGGCSGCAVSEERLGALGGVLLVFFLAPILARSTPSTMALVAYLSSRSFSGIEPSAFRW